MLPGALQAVIKIYNNNITRYWSNIIGFNLYPTCIWRRHGE